ncbi:hypothetical protein B566_EDAN012599 [Ephemera danica]|nr:hypothetical protein B566_EDAN012599 [Ephemera danica]
MRSTIVFIVALAVAGSLTHAFHLRPKANAQVPYRASLNVTCTFCRQFLDAAMTWMSEGMSTEELINRLTAMCVQSGAFNERVCRGTIEIYIDTFIWIADTRNATGNPLTPSDMCGLGLYPDCNLDSSKFEWMLDLDFLGSKPTPEEGSPTVKVLQITDVHVDPNYAPGYDAECKGEPTCCRADQGIPADPNAAAGYWGDYRLCDAPMHAYENLVQDAATRHQDIAYMIFSGDLTDHAVWASSEQYNSDLITYVVNTFSNNFHNVPVINIFGNHESHPTSVYLAADLWTPWLTPDTRPDILAGGMFTTEVRPGLVVIGINTMFCYSANAWVMYDNVDPAGELMWLANKLLEVETAGKKAHILGHHPSGHSNCFHMWSTQYRRIIDRFENTVMAQFHGHTHNDHFAVYYDLADISRATSVSFTAGSGTPFTEVNPNYRVYVVDADPASYRVLDHETWYYNLTEANLGGQSVPPNWQLMYTFNDAYGTSAPFPSQMDDLVHRMVNDTVLQDKYWRYYEKLGDPALAEGCDERCMERLICRTVTTVQGDTSKCDELYPAV